MRRDTLQERGPLGTKALHGIVHRQLDTEYHLARGRQRRHHAAPDSHTHLGHVRREQVHPGHDLHSTYGYALDRGPGNAPVEESHPHR